MGSIPSRGAHSRQLINVPLSHQCFFRSLKINKRILRWESKKEKENMEESNNRFCELHHQRLTHNMPVLPQLSEWLGPIPRTSQKSTRPQNRQSTADYGVSWPWATSFIKCASIYYVAFLLINVSIFKVKIMFVRLLGVTHFCDIFNIWLKLPPSQGARPVYKPAAAADVPQSHLVSSFKPRHVFYYWRV